MKNTKDSEAAKKVKKAQKGFYIHVAIYVLVNVLFFINNARLGNSDSNGFYLMIVWGIGVAIHWYVVYLEEEKARKEMKDNK